MRIEVVTGDATKIEADVLALKYAQAPYGLDAYVAQRLMPDALMILRNRLAAVSTDPIF